MAGLLLLVVGIVWLLVCIGLATMLAGTVRTGLASAFVALATFAGLAVAPIADDVLGIRQYKRYCAEADHELQIVGEIKVPLSAGLHTNDGEWRIAKLGPGQHDERRRLTELADGLVRWDHGTSVPTTSVFPINQRTTRIYDAASGRLLAEWKSYYYRGGFLRSNLLDSASQCFPSLHGSALYQRLIVFQRS